MQSRLKEKLIQLFKLSKTSTYHIWCPHVCSKSNFMTCHLLFNLLVTKFYCFTCEDYFFGKLLHVFTWEFLKKIELYSHLSLMFSLLAICYLTSYTFLKNKKKNVKKFKWFIQLETMQDFDTWNNMNGRPHFEENVCIQ